MKYKMNPEEEAMWNARIKKHPHLAQYYQGLKFHHPNGKEGLWGIPSFYQVWETYLQEHSRTNPRVYNFIKNRKI